MYPIYVPDDIEAIRIQGIVFVATVGIIVAIASFGAIVTGMINPEIGQVVIVPLVQLAAVIAICMNGLALPLVAYDTDTKRRFETILKHRPPHMPGLILLPPVVAVVSVLAYGLFWGDHWALLYVSIGATAWFLHRACLYSIRTGAAHPIRLFALGGGPSRLLAIPGFICLHLLVFVRLGRAVGAESTPFEPSTTAISGLPAEHALVLFPAVIGSVLAGTALLQTALDRAYRRRSAIKSLARQVWELIAYVVLLRPR